MPETFEKYKLELIEEKVHNSLDNRYYYKDLNNDGSAEEIRAKQKRDNNAAIIVRLSNNNVIDQWNLIGNFVFTSNKTEYDKKLSFLDINNDGVKEIYTLTQKDSILFLNCILPFQNKKIAYSKPIINNYHNEYENDLINNKIMKADLNQDNKFEILFSLRTGYGIHPRKLFAYDPRKDTFWSSPFLCNTSEINEIKDINGDQSPEIILRSSGSGNFIDSTKYNCTDYEVRLWVLNVNLKPAFSPIVHQKPYSSFNTYRFDNNDSIDLITHQSIKNTKDNSDKLLLLNNNGKVLIEKDLPKGNFHFLKSGTNNYIILSSSTGNLYSVKKNFTISRAKNLSPYGFVSTINVDNDDDLELFFISSDWKEISIAQQDGSHLTSHPIPASDDRRYIFGSFKENETWKLFVQRGFHINIFSYQNNPWYGMQYPLYGGIYLGLLGLIFLVIKGQKLREERRHAITRQISELQIKNIKNQVDPHFVFNSINAISAMVQEDDKRTADRFIVQFSNLMRQTLASSDKVATSLKKELDYTENYIQLQQIRFDHKFDYDIQVNDRVDMRQTVPKYVIYAYVENAIKHGLAHKMEGDGMLRIKISQMDSELNLLIEDNGVGSQSQKMKNPYSTGKGMKIMEQIYDLYQRIYKRKISHHTSDITDEYGTITGHRVEVKFRK